MDETTPPEPVVERVVPNRLSADSASDYYDAAALPGLKVFRNGKRASSVVEYSLSGGWIVVHLLDGRGQPKRERGKVKTITLFGTITATYDD